MEDTPILIHETTSVRELADKAIFTVVEGNIDPLKAWINIRRIKAAIEIFEKNDHIKDIMLRELSKYGNRQQFGDCVLEEHEAGNYDFSECRDSKLFELYARRDEIAADIKARESMLKNLPVSGMADPDTGELIYPPVRSSKTTIRTTFKK